MCSVSSPVYHVITISLTMSRTEVSSERVRPVALINSDPLFAVADADIDQQQRDAQLLELLLLGRRGPMSFERRLIVVISVRRRTLGAEIHLGTMVTSRT